jgi:Zn-dependent protease/predicted transcriptional regulator
VVSIADPAGPRRAAGGGPHHGCREVRMFGRKFKLFRLMGFEVGLDPSWIVLAVLVAWSLSTGYFPFKYRDLSAASYWIMGIVGAIGLFVSIVAHEFCHSLMARRQGMPMQGITLFIFGGVAEMGAEPSGPKDEFLIAVVGPLASLGMAAVFYGVFRLGDAAGWATAVTGIMIYLAMINTVLAVFNLVPAFPLDGGRILRAVLWGWKGDLKRATRIASRIGQGFGVLLIVLGVFRVLTGMFIGGMWLFLIGLFIHGAAKMSYRQLLTRQALEGEALQRFMNRNPVTVAPDIRLDRLVEDYIYRYHHKLFPVVDGERLVGCVTTRQVKAVPREQWAATTVGELTEACSDANSIRPDTDAVDALARMHRSHVGRLMVVEDGRLQGIIALKDLLHFLSMKIEFEEV